ncbi:alpha/beta fold hydrolase [uncultured Nocardioides sp.]|uniref:esterase/lipase family protein n=1 Tax=uncultured Nocardioides sp. TaxID=198441 RepID=UPI0026371159|nr:alpha/beta fold hydrolase [uncultured Nocardioides sp.]
MPTREPTLLEALSLASAVADELVVGTVRDTHHAVADRLYGALRRPTGGLVRVPEAAHRAVSAPVYAGLGLGLRTLATGLGAVGSRGIGPRVESERYGRHLRAAVNGLIGDRLRAERHPMAITMSVRRFGRDVGTGPEDLAAAYPRATGRVVVLLHGLCEDEEHFRRGRHRRGTTYAEELAEHGWTPVLVRYNTGLSLRENGVELTALLQRLVDRWPVPVERVALVGHSMGGLVARAACAVATGLEAGWTAHLTDVVTLATPHLGAPLAGGVGHGSRALARYPEAAAFARILDQRSVGVHDLVKGLSDDVPPLPRVRYRLVSAALSTSERGLLRNVVGDMLVGQESAYGRRHGRELFPGAEVMHLSRAGHFDLLNHADVAVALRRWLA